MENEFIINRARWRCGIFDKNGHGWGETRLLNYEGYMCCLGFYALHLGADKESLLDCIEPSDYSNETGFEWPEWLTDNDQEFFSANDGHSNSRKEREEEVARLFRECGNIEVVFVGEYEEK